MAGAPKSHQRILEVIEAKEIVHDALHHIGRFNDAVFRLNSRHSTMEALGGLLCEKEIATEIENITRDALIKVVDLVKAELWNVNGEIDE